MRESEGPLICVVSRRREICCLSAEGAGCKEQGIAARSDAQWNWNYALKVPDCSPFKEQKSFVQLYRNSIQAARFLIDIRSSGMLRNVDW
jgi:hypothetical protein